MMKGLLLVMLFVLPCSVCAILPDSCSTPCSDFSFLHVQNEEVVFNFSLVKNMTPAIPDCVLLERTEDVRYGTFTFSCPLDDTRYKIINYRGKAVVRYAANVTLPDALMHIEFSIPDQQLPQLVMLKRNFADVLMKFSLGFGIFILFIIFLSVLYVLYVRKSKR
ncbi:MAG: hypothetical protein V1725_01260 [archaeon]